MQLLQELQRISGNPVLIESGWKKWQNITDKIAAQASIEAEHSDRLSDVLSSVSTCHGMSFLLVFLRWYRSQTAQFLIPLKFIYSHMLVTRINFCK